MTELHPDLARVLIDERTIKQRVAELAAQMSKEYADVENLYLVGILKGAFIFMADLCRHLTIPHVVDFMALSSYGTKGARSGAVRIMMDLRADIQGKHVLIVEDIVDTGNTLDYLYQVLGSRGPASLHTCVLTRKRSENLSTIIDYLGFEIPDVWVVGYGLDFAEKHRTWPFIAELKQNV